MLLRAGQTDLDDSQHLLSLSSGTCASFCSGLPGYFTAASETGPFSCPMTLTRKAEFYSHTASQCRIRFAISLPGQCGGLIESLSNLTNEDNSVAIDQTLETEMGLIRYWASKKAFMISK